jgi:isocitrate dehydrogenase
MPFSSDFCSIKLITMDRITIAKGDGIGPEIMSAVLDILNEAGAQLVYDEIEIGEKSYLAGNSSGISPEAWSTLRNNKVFLKAPITTPQGGGYKSLNVTIRKTLGLFANVRPCKSWHPFVTTRHPEMDLVIIRENEEDLYAGIEHQQTHEVVQCLKLISRPGCEKIVRYAFEYAKKYGRKKVTCFTKDNIMKQTDGLFKSVFYEIAKEYPEIENEHWIIDIGAAKIADTPEHFDVVVMPNLYGDVVSDIAAQIAGSVGLAGSANIGEGFAMFEAIHGSAPDIAGKNIANPSGLLHGAILMLLHLGQSKVAESIQNAWAKTLEDGIHTADIYREGTSAQKVSTKAFAEAVKANLGKKPKTMAAANYADAGPMVLPKIPRTQSVKELKGVDVFVDWSGEKANELAEMLQKINTTALKLNMITNRGVKVWPNGFEETFCTDHWRCRFIGDTDATIAASQIVELLHLANENNIDVIKTENLYNFNGKQAYSLGQGQ